MNYSFSEENYLKAIFHLQEKQGKVSTSALAAQLKTKPSSITDMMKKLAAKDLLLYKPYYGFSLSAEGKRIALNVIRRHRLWEYFLAEKLQFGWDEVHQVAEELEHISNKKLVEKLDAYLGFPQFDPHGDPIPDSLGKITQIDQVLLSELPLNQKAVITSVANHSTELLEALNEKKIAIGTEVELKKRFEFDGSLHAKIKNKTLTLTDNLAKNIYVKKL